MSKLTPTQYIKRMAKRAGVKLNPVYDQLGRKASHESVQIANELMPYSTPKTPLTPDRAIAYIQYKKL